MNYHHEPFVPTYVPIIPQLVRHSGFHRHNHLRWPPSNAKVRCNAAAVPLALPRLLSWGRNCKAWFPKRFASWHNDDSCVISTTSANMDANIAIDNGINLHHSIIILQDTVHTYTVIFLTVSRAMGNRNWTQWSVRLLMFTLKTRDFGAEQQCSGCFLQTQQYGQGFEKSLCHYPSSLLKSYFTIQIVGSIYISCIKYYVQYCTTIRSSKTSATVFGLGLFIFTISLMALCHLGYLGLSSISFIRRPQQLLPRVLPEVS